jgi:hypothetical protein
MVALTPPVVASTGATSIPLPQATLVSAPSIRKFLDAQNVTAAVSPAVANATAAVVRVICVRR